MSGRIKYSKKPLALLLISIMSGSAYSATSALSSDAVSKKESDPVNLKTPVDENKKDDGGDVMVIKAEEALKQQPGVSIITKKDIENDPPVNDLSDIIRKMPGVNLTGNSANGARGNNRQIDIRGMGPENTLILVDGNPVTSRNAVRYSRTGERDTRGDTNWVPVEMVDHIDVLRGPAAARYGSGAMGGVVNIITKRPTNEWHGSLSAYTNQPENSKEGDTKRTNFSLSGPLIDDVLTMRLYGNINKTDADAYDINSSENGSYAAGREGVRNRDINAAFEWKINQQQYLDFSYGYSRQGNIYAGDTQYSNSNVSTLVPTLYGAETNRMYRQTYNVTHNGIWDWGQTKLSLNYEKTNNTRLSEGSTGKVEGMINSTDYSTSRYENYKASGEATVPLYSSLFDQTLTVGTEWEEEKLNDPASMQATSANGIEIDGVSGNASDRSARNSQRISSLYLEDNMDVLRGTTVIPGVRLDYQSRFGANWSPSLNASQQLGDYFKLKAGIARVFKAPNLYQSSEGYLLASSGNGCAIGSTGGCYLLGNKNLNPEVSVNKEIGLQFDNKGYSAGVTYFRNDYSNKIVSGTTNVGSTSNGYAVYRWENGGKALVEGLEGNLTVPLVEDKLNWRTNATYMFVSKYKETGNPLSIIPKYTINTMLDWQVTDKLSANANWTLYGRQKPRTAGEIRKEASGLDESEIGAYALVGIGGNYQLTKDLRLNVGISNLFDKQIYRSAEGAVTYNQPGRAYYTGVTATF